MIFHEFGVDKTSDVLDSVEAAHLFDDLYIQALLHPDRIPQSVQEVTEAIKTRANEASAKNAALAGEEALSADEAKAALNLPVGDWVRRMTVNYLDACGGKVEAELDCLRIQWPGESEIRVFYLPSQSGAAPANAELLRLDHPKVRGLLSRLPRFVPGMPIPLIRFASFPANIAGIWSLWEIKIVTHDRHRRRMMPLFVHEDGRVLVPTARFLWEQLCAESWKLVDADSVATTEQSFPACEKLALEQSRDIYFENTSASPQPDNTGKRKDGVQLQDSPQDASKYRLASGARFPAPQVGPRGSRMGRRNEATEPGDAGTHTIADAQGGMTL